MGMWRWVIRAVLVLVLLALVFMRFGHKQPSYGFSVLPGAKDCGESNEDGIFLPIHLQISVGGKAKFNSVAMPIERVPNRLVGIWETRKRRVLYLEPDKEVTFQEVIALIDRIESKKQGIAIVLVTPRIRKECGFDWLFRIYARSNKSARPDGDEGCLYMESRKGLSGYESGGPFYLDHFRLTKGRTDLREFLWMHWHQHIRGIAEVSAGTVDRGIVKGLYIIQPDAQGRWGIDVELDRPMDPPCVSFHADSIVRVPIRNPEEDYPSQTLGIWPAGEKLSNRLADSVVVDSKLYGVVLVRENEALTNPM